MISHKIFALLFPIPKDMAFFPPARFINFLDMYSPNATKNKIGSTQDKILTRIGDD